NSGSATSGQVGIADGSGNVTYGNISSENVDGADLTAGDGSITVVDGTGATLVEANLRVAADGITNDKLADNAVNTENIVDGAIEASDINSNVAGDGLTQNTTTGALEVSANNGVTATTDNIQLGGDLIQPTAITTDATNTLAVEGLQDGSATDNIVVADPNTGELKQLKAAMPKFFYMPSVVFDTSTQDTGITRNLHQDYVDQFGSPVVSSSGASGAIPTLDANDLEYYITYYDDTVFENVSIDAVGNLTYDVISSTNSAASFMNIVFVVK
ncbi:collagen, type VII, alpha, partial [Salegentibacter salinarum]